MPPETATGILLFAGYFAGSIGYCALFCLVYAAMTGHAEFHLIVRQHNASAAVAFGMSLVGFAIALASAVHNSASIVEFAVWGMVALVGQLVAYGLAKLSHPGLSHAITENAIAAALWAGSVSVAVGLLSAACMSP